MPHFGRKRFPTKVKEKVTPSATKSDTTKIKESVTTGGDRVTREAVPDSQKSFGQKMQDTTGRAKARIKRWSRRQRV
ncbi:MAG: hypothetical protein Q9160_001822 [Pyrenula sp. 1 TL-2023]